MSTRWGARILLLLIVVTTFGCDQATKQYALTHLDGSPRRSFLMDTVRLEVAHNRGAFLSLGASLPEWGRTALFSVGTALLIIACVAWGMRAGLQRTALVGLWLMVGGGLSNLVDRLVRGSVIDFMNVGLGPVRTGIFNVADVAIMAGLVLLVISAWRHERP